MKSEDVPQVQFVKERLEAFEVAHKAAAFVEEVRAPKRNHRFCGAVGTLRVSYYPQKPGVQRKGD